MEPSPEKKVVKGGSLGLAAMLKARTHELATQYSEKLTVTANTERATSPTPNVASNTNTNVENRDQSPSRPQGQPAPPNRPPPPRPHGPPSARGSVLFEENSTEVKKPLHQPPPPPAPPAPKPVVEEPKVVPPQSTTVNNPPRTNSPPPSTTVNNTIVRTNSPPPTSTSTSNSSPAPTANTSTKYTPKTTGFQGANKCYVCSTTVYKTEEIIAVGQVWHTSCFTCGGTNSDGCKKTLRRDGYVDHAGQPYCNNCYNKLFRTKGYGYGNTLNTDYGENLTKVDAYDCRAGSNAPTKPVVGTTAATAVNSGVSEKKVNTMRSVFEAAAVVGENFTSKTPATTNATTAKVTPAVPQNTTKNIAASFNQASNAPATAPTPKYTPTNNTSIHNNVTAPKCTSCAKSVYKVEEVIAVGRVWHTFCFTCGGTKGDGCKRVLKRDGYVDHDNQPYCNACYSKLFRPKGFGYGNTLNTDYGPAPAEVATETTSAKTTTTPWRETNTSQGTATNAGGVSSSNTGTHIIPPTSVTGIKTGPGPAIGTTSKAAANTSLYREANYVGDHDEVDEAEW